MKELKKEKIEITERGWAGHFCESHRCLFTRNTLIECGTKRVVVSTVGAYLDGQIKKIGAKHYYETLVFEAKWEEPYWEANTLKPISVKADTVIEILERSSSKLANCMHEEVVKEMCNAIIKTLPF